LAASAVAHKRLRQNLGRVPQPPVVAHREPRCLRVRKVASRRRRSRKRAMCPYPSRASGCRRDIPAIAASAASAGRVNDDRGGGGDYRR
jgi:hypothetical protein